MELRPYQVEAKAAIYEEWKGKKSTLLVLPTGCGKTVVFVSIAKERTGFGRVLILAHREELLTQAADKVEKLYGEGCAVEKADLSCLDSEDLIVVGSVQTMMSKKRLEKFPKDYFGTIIIDEAHHAMAKSYKNILEHFDQAKVLGVTATPDRGDMKSLNEIFESLAFEYSLREAVQQGYLSPIRVQTMPLNIDLGNVKVQAGDFQAAEVGHALEPYLEDIAEEMAKVCKDRHTVVFLPLIEMSQSFRDILNTKGFRAAEVNGQSKNRDQILSEFAAGKFNVLCNSMLLTEGWDCPIVDCIVVLRPTKVRSLYCQMVGRGTRLYPGKDHLLILDFLWMTGKHDLVHPADIICKKAEDAKAVTEKLAATGTDGDLFDLERDAIQERRDSLKKAIEEATNQRKQKKLIDPLSFCVFINNDSLIDYVPTFGWEMEPMTERQAETLENMGIRTTRKMTKGQASRLIDVIAKDRKGLSTPKQINRLRNFGFVHPEDWTKEEANSVMSRLAASGWSPWRAGYNPGNYRPERLRRDEAWT